MPGTRCSQRKFIFLCASESRIIFYFLFSGSSRRERRSLPGFLQDFPRQRISLPVPKQVIAKIRWQEGEVCCSCVSMDLRCKASLNWPADNFFHKVGSLGIGRLNDFLPLCFQTFCGRSPALLTDQNPV